MADKATFPRCEHTHNCDCSGGVQGYALCYNRLLQVLTPDQVFEWGPGLNTEQALALSTTRRVVSVEQDPKWIPEIKFQRQVIIHLQDSSKMYTGRDMAMFGCLDFDLFFVDSRRRAECINAVYDVVCPVNPEVVVCLHDAQRDRYHDALADFKYVHFFFHGLAAATQSFDKYNAIKDIKG